MGTILATIITFLTSLPKILALAELLIKLYEDGVKQNESKLLAKADDDVTKFVTRVQASQRVRQNGTGGEQKTDATPANNQCDCGGSGLCDRCPKDN